jgi:hypothetical protein
MGIGASRHHVLLPIYAIFQVKEFMLRRKGRCSRKPFYYVIVK